jgi:hypothetical protein
MSGIRIPIQHLLRLEIFLFVPDYYNKCSKDTSYICNAIGPNFQNRELGETVTFYPGFRKNLLLHLAEVCIKHLTQRTDLEFKRR